MDGYKGILEQLRNTPECRSGQFPLVLHRSTSSTRDSRTQKKGVDFQLMIKIKFGDCNIQYIPIFLCLDRY